MVGNLRTIKEPLKLAVVGVGRIGVFHARHVQELGEAAGTCELVAVADRYGNTADNVARSLGKNQASEIRAFKSTRGLVDAGLIDAAVVASRTEDHETDTRTLIDAGCRVMLEKPLTHSVASAAAFVRDLSHDNTKKQALMQAFMRRFDEPLCHAKDLLDGNTIGDPFKVVSVLEDPHPPPVGYHSPGILPDMAVHNIDEAIWLLHASPVRARAMGANLHNYRITTVKEDFDDAFLQLAFPDDVIAQVQVSRNHVAGYRNETWIYGRSGQIHVGRFQEDPLQVSVEAYNREGAVEKKSFPMRDYGGEVPVFIERFGPAYKRELAHFIDRCLKGEPFRVTQEDGLRAMQVADAGIRSLRAGAQAVTIPAF